MIDTLTKTEKKTTRRTVERDYILYPYPKSNVVLAKVVTKDTNVKKGEPVTTWYLFSQATYEKYQHRKTWTWIINLGQDHRFTVITAEYMNHYVDGISCQYPYDKPKHVDESDWKKVLDAGDYNRVARDQAWYDGMMYDPRGRPILRGFRFDYINGGLDSDHYDLPKLEEWLKRQKNAKNVERISVPYYNEDSCGSQAIEFIFQPSPRIFLRMFKEKALSGFELSEFVKKHLGIDKFRVNQML